MTGFHGEPLEGEIKYKISGEDAIAVQTTSEEWFSVMRFIELLCDDIDELAEVEKGDEQGQKEHFLRFCRTFGAFCDAHRQLIHRVSEVVIVEEVSE